MPNCTQKRQENNSILSWAIEHQSFSSTFSIPLYAWPHPLKLTSSIFRFPWIPNWMQKINKITKLNTYILVISTLSTLWVCLGHDWLHPIEMTLNCSFNRCLTTYKNQQNRSTLPWDIALRRILWSHWTRRIF